jgi:hypothetical protein
MEPQEAKGPPEAGLLGGENLVSTNPNRPAYKRDNKEHHEEPIGWLGLNMSVDGCNCFHI